MLEEYFIKPATIDRLRGSWIAAEIETYVAWLAGQGYSTKSIWRRVPVVFAFGQFGRERGAQDVTQLPAYVEAFVDERVALHRRRTRSTRPMAKEVRGPVEQMLSVVLPGFEPTGRAITPSLSPIPFPGSSTTWAKSEGCARRRSTSTATIWTVSRPTSLGSGSGPSVSSRRRSSAPTSSSAPALVWQKALSATARECCGCSSATPTGKASWPAT
jgi:hypothetical protein